MKRILSVALLLLLVFACAQTALAQESGGDGDGFYMEELPAFGEEENELFFPSEEPPRPAPTAEPAAPESSAAPEETAPPEQPAEDEPPTERDSVEPGASPSPETTPAPSNATIHPVILIGAALAVCALAFVLVRTRKKQSGTKNDTDIGGRK